MRESQTSSSDQLIAVADLLLLLRVGGLQVLAGIALGAALGFGLSYSITPVYQARVMVLPVRTSEVEGLSGLANQLGGLAALSGINLGSDEERMEFTERLKSRALAQRFIESQDLMPKLFSDRWDETTSKWRADGGEAPTLSDGIRLFQDEIQTISEDRRTGVLTVSIEWADPVLAQEWANAYVRLANSEMRERAISEAQDILRYVDRQIEKTSLVGVREALYRMAEAQLKTEAVASVREDYAFNVIDPAYLPDDEDIVRPRRLVMAASGGFVGALLFGLLAWNRAKRIRAAPLP